MILEEKNEKKTDKVTDSVTESCDMESHFNMPCTYNCSNPSCLKVPLCGVNPADCFVIRACRFLRQRK